MAEWCPPVEHRVEPCISVECIRDIMAKPKTKRWIHLVTWGAYYSIGEDELSCERIAKLVPNDAWPAYVEQVVSLIDGANSVEGACFAYGVFGPHLDRAALDAQFGIVGESDPAKSAATRSSDRRRSDLSRLAFRKLRAGTTRRALISYLSEANSMLRQPLSASDIESLTTWCIAKHAAEVASKKSDARTRGARDAA